MATDSFCFDMENLRGFSEGDQDDRDSLFGPRNNQNQEDDMKHVPSLDFEDLLQWHPNQDTNLNES